jgi:hypothetical protein
VVELDDEVLPPDEVPVVLVAAYCLALVVFG